MAKYITFLSTIIFLFSISYINDAKCFNAKNNSSLKVLTLVNSEPITNFDLVNRVNFILFVTGLKKEQIKNKDIYRDAMHALVMEKLKIQLAKETIPEIISKAEEVANDLVDKNFSKNNKSAKVFLNEKNLKYSTIYEKYLSDILWSNILRHKFKKQFMNIDIIAKQELERIKKNKSSAQIKLSEIILLPNTKRTLDQTLTLAKKIVDAINNGANFENIAQQYSSSSTSSKGGSVNWILESSLPKELKKPLKNAPSGKLLDPILSNGQVYIIRKEAVRAKGLLDPRASIISIARTMMPVPLESTSGQVLSLAAKLQQETEVLNNCNEMEKLNEKLGSKTISILENISLGSLSQELQNELLNMKIGEITKPLNFDDGLVIFMLCSRETPKLNLPDLKTLESIELEKLFSSLGSRYINRIERSAIIEYKNQNYLN